jgi:hypothetical protein
MIAWFYERTGLFMVRSAYMLAVELEQHEAGKESCSARPEGDRPIFKGIWTTKVPPKVRVFAWRLAKDRLATYVNRKKRTLAKHTTCQVCGREDETAYHAVVRCPKATTLRHELRVVWALPKVEDFRCTGPDWLLLLLDRADDTTRAQVLLLFWWAWHLRNNVMHGDGVCTVTGSAKFLELLADSMDLAARDSKGGGDDRKEAN